MVVLFNKRGALLESFMTPSKLTKVGNVVRSPCHLRSEAIAKTIDVCKNARPPL